MRFDRTKDQQHPSVRRSSFAGIIILISENRETLIRIAYAFALYVPLY